MVAHDEKIAVFASAKSGLTVRAPRSRYTRRGELLDPSTLPRLQGRLLGNAQRSRAWAGRSSQAGRTVFA